VYTPHAVACIISSMTRPARNPNRPERRKSVFSQRPVKRAGVPTLGGRSWKERRVSGIADRRLEIHTELAVAMHRRHDDTCKRETCQCGEWNAATKRYEAAMEAAAVVFS